MGRIGFRMQQDRIKEIVTDSAANIKALAEIAGPVADVCDAVVKALKEGHKVLTAGNGGSSAEALHMAEELVGRFRGNRVSLPGISLAADSTAITCIGNDYGYDSIFSRQVEGLGKKGDVLVLFSTSGSAGNLEMALESAKKLGMTVISLLGRDGGALAGRSDYELIPMGDSTERIQEVHQVLVHIILDAVELAFTE